MPETLNFLFAATGAKILTNGRLFDARCLKICRDLVEITSCSKTYTLVLYFFSIYKMRMQRVGVNLKSEFEKIKVQELNAIKVQITNGNKNDR